MRELPILFSGPMVRAILDGRKTQTRRVAKCPIWTDKAPNPAAPHVYGRVATTTPCPYGHPGDRLWIRETWHTDTRDLDRAKAEHLDLMSPSPIFYRADNNPPDAGFRWRPSIFMPRWASRITLDVVAVRVERLNEISDEDCVAEGIKTSRGAGPICGERTFHVPRSSAYSRIGWHAYSVLWESINGVGSWAANPWVWVVEFRRLAP